MIQPPNFSELSRRIDNDVMPDGDDGREDTLASLLQFVGLELPRAARLELRHYGERAQVSRVREWDTAGKGAGELARGALDAAVADARVQRGVQRYLLLSFRVGETAYAARLLFRIGEDPFENGSSLTEDADGRGHLAQMMRHTEIVMRVGVGSMYDTHKQLRQELREAHKRCHQLESKHVAVLELLEQLTNRAAERELETRREARADERKTQIVNRVMEHLPTLMDKLLASPVLSSAGAERYQAQITALKHFTEVINDDDFAFIAANLAPDKRQALHDLIARVAELRATAPAAPNTSPPQASTPPAPTRAPTPEGSTP